MKIEIEQQDIQAIAERVLELLRPLLARNGKQDDIILTPESLAEYLQVDTSWVYKQVSLKTIPYFKSGKYTRFKRATIDKWIETQTVKPIPPLKLVKNAKSQKD